MNKPTPKKPTPSEYRQARRIARLAILKAADEWDGTGGRHYEEEEGTRPAVVREVLQLLAKQMLLGDPAKNPGGCCEYEQRGRGGSCLNCGDSCF